MDLLTPQISPVAPATDYITRLSEVASRLKTLTPAQRSARARDLAQYLGLSEEQWIAAAQDRVVSRPLRCEPHEFFNRLPGLGEVIAITRNDACVHELRGTYENLTLDRGVLLVQGQPIDLRLFLTTINSIWAVSELGRHSLQCFDQAGRAVHKIYCAEQTNLAAYHQLVADYAHEPVTWPNRRDPVTESLSPCVEQPQVLREAWLAMQDTHEFYGLIKRFKVTRVAAFKAVGCDLAQRVDSTVVEDMLTDAARLSIPIMCFVSNGGAIQIYSGSVQTLYRKGPWYNIIDPSFNLHLNTEAIDSVWVVSKPTIEGWVTSLEVYDQNECLIVQFFGARKPGQAELFEWRDLLQRRCPDTLASCSD